MHYPTISVIAKLHLPSGTVRREYVRIDALYCLKQTTSNPRTYIEDMLKAKMTLSVC